MRSQKKLRFACCGKNIVHFFAICRSKNLASKNNEGDDGVCENINGDFVVVASCIFRHMGVGVVTSGIIQMLPKMQVPTKFLSKSELFPQNHSEPIFYFRLLPIKHFLPAPRFLNQFLQQHPCIIDVPTESL